MAEFLTIDWLILYAILFVLFGTPIIAIVRENSEIRLGRIGLLYWVLGFFAFEFVGTLVSEIFEHTSQTGMVIFGIVFLIANIVFCYLLAGRLVRRARDAGMGKTIAYLSLIPLINIATVLVLLFKESSDSAKVAVDS